MVFAGLAGFLVVLLLAVGIARRKERAVADRGGS